MDLVGISYPPVSMESPRTPPNYRLFAAFWCLGLLNNTAYVIMLACAKDISEGGTALVFLANILPGLAIKTSAPYWFDQVSYDTRLKVGTICMMGSFSLVASSTSSHSHASTLWIQLLGVSLTSAQGGLGEASLLALAGKADGNAATHSNSNNSNSNKGQCLTSFASGTGMAGVFGFFWKWFWKDWMGFSLAVTLWLALGLAIAYWRTFRYAQTHYQQPGHKADQEDAVLPESELQALTIETDRLIAVEDDETTTTSVVPIVISGMTGSQRFHLVLSLWPYMVPLFVVYAAEYALQSGTWAAIGFPLDDLESRDHFFQYSNWMYQVGVFLSRSSGTLFTVPLWVLWTMPALQVGNLAVYTYVASHPTTSVLYQPLVLYAGALYTGLLGGAVYISGYKRICGDLPLAHREFALSATSVAECLGIVLADALGLVLQACLYQVNGLHGALLGCPVTF
jgi:battenin